MTDHNGQPAEPRRRRDIFERMDDVERQLRLFVDVMQVAAIGAVGLLVTLVVLHLVG